MRSHVFNDLGLVKQAGRFVWLSVDTEKDASASFVEKFPVQSWPTLFIIDPSDQKVALKWVGSAGVPELEKLLSAGEGAVHGVASKLEQQLAAADGLFGQGKPRQAAEAYAAVVEQAPLDWPNRPRAIESLVFAWQNARDRQRCAETALQYAPSLPRTSSLANVATTGLSCALTGTDKQPWREEAIAGLESINREALLIENLLADDRSGIYEALINAREVNKDKAAVQTLAIEWNRFLEREAAKATTAEARAAFDPHRLVVALRLNQVERMIEPLKASERGLPWDYNPPARLAVVYRELGRYGEALAAIDRALARAYGPRKLRLFDSKVLILTKKGDVATARRTLEEALQFASTIPSQQVPTSMVQKMRSDLEKLDHLTKS